MKNRVVITGMGVVAPGAANLRQFDNNLKNGISPVTFQAKLEQLQFNCQVAAVAQIDEQEHMPVLYEHQLENASDFIKLTVIAGLAAWHDAGFVVPNKEELSEPDWDTGCLLYTSPSPRDRTRSRMPSSA